MSEEKGKYDHYNDIPEHRSDYEKAVRIGVNTDDIDDYLCHLDADDMDSRERLYRIIISYMHAEERWQSKPTELNYKLTRRLLPLLRKHALARFHELYDELTIIRPDVRALEDKNIALAYEKHLVLRERQIRERQQKKEQEDQKNQDDEDQEDSE